MAILTVVEEVADQVSSDAAFKPNKWIGTIEQPAAKQKVLDQKEDIEPKERMNNHLIK